MTDNNFICFFLTNVYGFISQVLPKQLRPEPDQELTIDNQIGDSQYTRGLTKTLKLNYHFIYCDVESHIGRK